MNESAKALLALSFIVCTIVSLICWFVPPPGETQSWKVLIGFPVASAASLGVLLWGVFRKDRGA